ncbi:MAG: 4-oxalocrotonate tautomerase DmpI [Candidatus Hodarchaeota archaeon]
MPNITIEGPELDLEAKRVLVKEVTDAAAKAFPHIAREHIVVILKANQPENVGVGGVLIVDRRIP